ncbi:hypothetical protein B296_00028369 [Ensete ventricosum]|uniref:Sugar phosphate transporter domain-containing protein n=1 Tax=Ensete ventricosum TaxID=4639 RepID=A0A427AN17_ENSVE|nr:hypothetical protein B296_00028369 [Ensete ventricosum]
MAGSDHAAQKDVEATGTKVDEDRTMSEMPSCSVDGSCDGGTSEEAENVESPLIRGEGLGRDVATQPESQRSPYFRQRSAVPGAEGKSIGKKYVPFDVVNGLHTTQSMLKLEEVERAAESSVSKAVVLKTLFYILVWYTFSTCLTLLETPSYKLLGIILIISFGVLLTVAKETQFDFWGFVFVMFAAVMSGFRWSMTQILLQVKKLMVLTEYILVSATSAVTVSIAGVVKEAVTIMVRLDT